MMRMRNLLVLAVCIACCWVVWPQAAQGDCGQVIVVDSGWWDDYYYGDGTPREPRDRDRRRRQRRDERPDERPDDRQALAPQAERIASSAV